MADSAPARRLVRRIFPWLSSEYLISSGIVTIPESCESIDAKFLSTRPFVAGTGILGGLVPPIASAPVRDLCGHENMTSYLLSSDTWTLLVGRFLKDRSKVLELGCGCGELARSLIPHPYIAKYLGVDPSETCIDWCHGAFLHRAPDRFEFHHLPSESGNSESHGESNESRMIVPAPDGAMDLVVSRSFLGQLDPSDLKIYLAEVRRVLAGNGLFLAAVARVAHDQTSDGQPGPSRTIHADQFQELAEEAGLQVYQRMGLLDHHELFIFTQASVATGSQREASRDLTEEMLKINEAAAEQQNVQSPVHPEDFIYWFCATHPLLSLEGGIHYYFRDGGTSAGKLVDLISGFEDLDLNSVKLLEFASGYGCVTRHLKKRPNIELVSCDIHPQALEFLSKSLGVRTLASTHQPEGFAPHEKYDVIFALSFFSHMPKRTFGRWMKALFQALHDPGYLVFTTLGVKACKDCGIEPSDIPEDGLWFEARSEQHDLDEAEYGMTIVTPEFVRAEVERQTGAPVVVYKHVGWWDNQDLWVIKRDN